MLTSPTRVIADIHRFCRRIVPTATPVFVGVHPHKDAVMDDCFINVEKHIAEHGGTIQHGWTIWEWPGIALDGEFHAVWRSPDGRYVDVSPKKDGEQQILFLADSTRVFEEERIDNIRYPIGKDPRIKEWIRAHERFQKSLDALMKNVPFGTRFELDEEAAALQMRCAELEVALAQSRPARRATQR